MLNPLTALRRAASHSVYERGRLYHLAGRVLEWHIERDFIVGTVLGSQRARYHTALAWDGRKWHARCSCPYDGFCKHAVALALAAVKDGDVPAPTPPPPQPPDWERALRQAIEPGPAFTPSVGETYLLYRLHPGPQGVAISIARARYGVRGLGRETPVNPWYLETSLPQRPTPLDSHLVRLLAPGPADYGTGNVTIPPAYLDTILELLKLHPFGFVGDGRERLRMLKPPLTGRVAFREERDQLVLDASLFSPGGEPATLPPDAVLAHGARLWVFSGHTCREIVTPDSPDLLFLGLRENKVAVPQAELGRFLALYLPRAGAAGDSALPPSLAARVKSRTPQPVLTLREEKKVLAGEVRFAYGGGLPVPPASGEGEITEAEEEGAAVWIIRETAAERAALERLAACGAAPDSDGRFVLSGEAALDFLHDHLPALAADWEVYGEEKLRRYRVARSGARGTARLTSGIDWFELSLELENEGSRATAADLWSALRTGSRYVRLHDGRQLRLPPEWENLRSLAGDAEAARMERGRLRLPRWEASLAAAILDAAGEVAADDSWHDFRRRLQNFRQIEDAAPPAGLRATLRPYQRHGYNWLRFLRDYGLHGILADDMGLGKTLQVLAVLLAEKERGAGTSLVVVPTSLVFNWLDEAGRFAPGLRVLPLVGTGRKERFQDMPAHDVVLTTYALLPRDGEALAAHAFNYVVLDEAQRIKNPASQTARAACALKARHRLALTGTPLENSLDELWSIFHFLMPGFLGSREQFAARYARPIQEARNREALERLRKRIHPFVLRRTKQEAVPELPPRNETVLTCELAPAQRRLYRDVLQVCRDRVMATVEEKGIAASHITILDALLKLRQICCHPQLLKAPGNKAHSSAKLDLFREMLDGILAAGNRVLVFSQFVEMLAILRRELDRMGVPYAYLDGRTPARERERQVKAFQKGNGAPVFLISLRAGGTGLNLTAASYVIHYDPWWNPAVETQATDRAHRIGQDKNVFCYKLITRGTVEEKILELQRHKQTLAANLLAGDPAMGKHLTREDLEELFTFGA
ncbi:MAG: SNF2-related protein [Bacillota bacterium]|nr:SNF2-related protein [Bacillota bacterium]